MSGLSCLHRTVFALLLTTAASALAGHSRHSYVDGGQSMDGRFVVTPRYVEGEKPKKGPTPFHWEYEWKDTKTGERHVGRLEGLRDGSSNVFEPVGSHVFVAPDGQTFALWTPQVMMRAPAKKPEGEPGDEAYRNFVGFSRRLVIYRNTGEVIKTFSLNDLLRPDDWDWFFFHQRQLYWLVDYEGLTTRSAPRPFYALYRISPDHTVLEFQVGANPEATHKARARGVVPPPPRPVRIRLTDGVVLEPDEVAGDPAKVPVQPFIGDLASKERKQRDYRPSLDPLRVPGRFGTPEEPESPARKD